MPPKRKREEAAAEADGSDSDAGGGAGGAGGRGRGRGDADGAGSSSFGEGSEDEGDAAEEEVVLPGADDPSYAEQYALWKERRFIDIWLQARPRRVRPPRTTLPASAAPRPRAALLRPRAPRCR